ncbi:hypothetical protein ILYODFUR_003904 [Ilyodon furcidens]|uniref:Nuclear mitotic apparatus protein 1 n=1 Tax=Ilyodon furcidens TaxID=33524 RepID=A0ABV0UD44_9TELE
MEMEISQQKDSFQNMRVTSEEETTRLREAIKAKEDQLISLKEEGSTQSDMLQHEIKSLQAQLCDMAKTMKTTEEKLQAQIEMLSKQEQDIYHQKELLQEQLSASEEKMRMMRNEIQSKEKQMELLKTENAEQLYLLHQETKSLNKQMETLSSSLRKAEDEIHSREDLLAVQRQENTEQSRELHSLQENVRQLKKQLEQRHSHDEDIERLKKSQAEKENELLEAEKKLQALQTELSEARMLICDKDQNLNTLRQEVVLQVNLLQKAKGEAEATEKIMAEIREENSRQKIVLQNEIQGLKGELETISQSLCAKEQKLLETQQASVEQVNNFQQQLLLVKGELDQQTEALHGSLRSKDAFQDLQLTTLKEKEALYQEKEVLMSNIIQAEGDQKALEEQVKVVILEKDRLAQANQALERENVASRRLEAVLQRELEILKMEKEQLLRQREEAEESELIKGELKQQLAAKTEAVEHYKAQMEKAVSHYNSKKQLLQKSEEDNMELKQALEVKDNEFKTILMENKALQLGLERIQANEKKLKGQVASLESQLAYADQVLRAQNKIHGNGGGATESAYLGLPRIHLGDGTTTQVKTSMSSDSLDQSSLEDSLNTTRKLSAPGESSTPLVRSSERLAAKRQGLQAESLETLYFTPINTRRTKRTSDDSDMDLNSTRKNPTSSVKRRRTTQVINITMSKKTPGCSEADETFYSLQSARSHPNLAGAHVSRPMSMEVFNTPASKTAAASDQLIGLPGYRQSTAHSQTASTFCVGAENEPDGGPEDWLRIAELQARNKTCLPHLKSSYPVESETGQASALIFTDEELRTGDPSDTIRRASMMPGQLQDSLVSHRHSLMMGHTGVGAHSHRLSLMPGQLPARPALSSQLKCPKSSKQSSSTFSIHQTSPEKKTRASCFPRPITPKNKNMSSGPSSTRLQAVLSPAERRQSMMFTIENTPKSNGYLKKGLNKLRNSARKTPLNSRATVGRSAKAGSLKSPQVAGKGQRGSQASRSAKSPGLTASARKVMRRMKI